MNEWESVPLQQTEESDRRPGFIVHLVLDDTCVGFEPDFSSYEETLPSVYELMITCGSTVPRVEKELYHVPVRSDKTNNNKITQFIGAHVLRVLTGGQA